MERFSAVSVLLVAAATAWAGDNPAPREGLVRAGDGRSAGAGASMGRPVLGYVAQSAPLELRAILGVPGAAVFSDALLIPTDSSSVRVAPGTSAWAWIERGNETPAILTLGGTRSGKLAGVSGVLPVADLAVFSPSGSALVLYSAASGRLQALSGLPDAPQIAQDVDARLLPGTPETLAVSDDAGAVLAASGGVVYRLSPGSAAQTVLNLTGRAGLAFLPVSRDAAVVDRAAGTVQMVRNGAGGVSSGLLAGGLAGAGEIAATGDGQNLVLTNTAANGMWMVNVSSGEVRSFSTPAGPVGLSRLANRDSYLISSEPGQPAWMFVADTSVLGGASGRTVFVPAAAPARARRD